MGSPRTKIVDSLSVLETLLVQRDAQGVEAHVATLSKYAADSEAVLRNVVELLVQHAHFKVADTLLQNVDCRQLKNPRLLMLVANVYRQNGRFTSATKEIFEKALSFSAVHSSDLLFDFLDYLWEAFELDKDWLGGFYRQHIDVLSFKVLCVLGPMLYQAGMLEEAMIVASRLKRMPLDMLPSAPRFVDFGVASGIFSASNEHVKYLRKVADKLQQGNDYLKSVLLSKNSIAVVGNSPCEKGLGKGGLVDSHDYVCRFNNYVYSKGELKDYGRKTSIWVRSVGDWVEERRVTDFDLVVLSGNNIHNRPMGWRRFKNYIDGDVKLAVFDTAIQHDLVRMLGAPASAGLTMCYTIHSYGRVLDRSSLFGFAFVDQLNEGVKNVGGTVAGLRHEWNAEKDLFERVVAGRMALSS